MNDVLARLQGVIEQRKGALDSEKSYVSSLHRAGLNKILEKVGEECTETIIAAKDAASSGDTGALISETADLWFHCMVMLSALDESTDNVLQELDRRFGLSGIDEKRSRGAG